MASLEPVDRRVEHRRQKEGDDEPANERAYLPEEEERAQHHHCGQQGNGDRAHDLRSRGAYPPSILAGHGRVRFRRDRFRFRLGFCLRVPLCGPLLVRISRLLIHISSSYGSLGRGSLAAPGRSTNPRRQVAIPFHMDVSFGLIHLSQSLVGTEPTRVGSSTAPFFSGASAIIPSTRRAYAAESGAAVSPCKSTLRSTVSATTSSISSRPASMGASATTMRPSTIEASPRGPNQPTNSMETPRSREPTREAATGSMRINVKLRRAYRATSQLKGSISPNTSTPKTKNTLRLSSCPSASVNRIRCSPTRSTVGPTAKPPTKAAMKPLPPIWSASTQAMSASASRARRWNESAIHLLFEARLTSQPPTSPTPTPTRAPKPICSRAKSIQKLAG